MYGYMKDLVRIYSDEYDALAVLAKVDHALKIPSNFKLWYDVSDIGSNTSYVLVLQYGIDGVRFIKMNVANLG